MKPKRKPPEFCRSSAVCFEPAGYGKFLSFCEPHWQELEAVMQARSTLATVKAEKHEQQREDALPTVEERTAKAVLPSCLVDGCGTPRKLTRSRRRGDESSYRRATCPIHSRGDVDPAALAQWDAENPRPQGRKPGPKPQPAA
jgi:hypothetical protein